MGRLKKNKTLKYTILSLIGLIIGLNAGIFGAGGGMMLLAVLIFILGYNLHMAIGTSILIMVFIAFFGSATHYYYKPFSLIFLLIAAIWGFIGARYSSIIANLTSEKNLKTVVGVLFALLGLFLTLNSFFHVALF